jgi:hypothetical protein
MLRIRLRAGTAETAGVTHAHSLQTSASGASVSFSWYRFIEPGYLLDIFA